MHMEIERKFLVSDISKIDFNLDNYECKIIKQDYLYVDKLTAIRKRKVTIDNINKYYYTIKTGKSGISVNEIEKDIDEITYNSLIENTKYNSILKKRYFIPYMEDLIIELDIFEGVYRGIIFAEIEYKDENQANSIELPKWFGMDISNLVTNSDMAMKSIQEIFDILKK